MTHPQYLKENFYVEIESMHLEGASNGNQIEMQTYKSPSDWIHLDIFTHQCSLIDFHDSVSFVSLVMQRKFGRNSGLNRNYLNFRAIVLPLLRGDGAANGKTEKPQVVSRTKTTASFCENGSK